ncbi:hypothetical protein QE152_g25117 [Popillia japonica]|uniref:Uncharacterized protein n=1 Tax=Popillia japonica TaxID=7064 RepID=A0AAW1K307_POPJA
MIFTRSEINDSFNGVGFRIPQYCNLNAIPPLKVYFDILPASNWTNFGTFSIPDNNTKYSTCFIERISYISVDISTYQYYQSYESVEYCPPTTFRMGPYMEKFEIAAPYGLNSLKSLYLNDELNILFAVCENRSLRFLITPYIPIDISSLISNQTILMYKPIANLWYADYSNVRLLLDSETTYIDLYLYTLNVVFSNAPSEGLIPIFNEGVKRLQLQAEHSNQLTHLALFTEVTFTIEQCDYRALNNESSTFVFQNINQKIERVMGVVLYNDNHIKPLTWKQPIDKFVIDDHMDVIVQLSHYEVADRVNSTTVIFTDNFYYEQSRLSKTKVDAWINSQIATDPRVQQMRRFARIHQAKFSNHRPLEGFYFIADDHPMLEYPQLTLQNVSSTIITMSGEMRFFHYMPEFYNAYVLLFVQEKYFYHIIRGRIHDGSPILNWFRLLLYLQHPLFELRRIIPQEVTCLVLNIWNPILSGIVGFAIDKKLDFNTAAPSLIHRNQVSHIDTKNQTIIAYFQEDFLGSIVEDTPKTAAEGFIAFMFFTKNEINDSYKGVGFRIPQYCNRNGTSPLKVYFDSSPGRDWSNFGSFDVPDKNMTYSTCLIERISYLGVDVSLNRYFQSSESVQYCPPTTFEIGPYVEEFHVTTIGRTSFPKSVYFDNNLNMLFAFCERNKSFTLAIVPYIPINVSHLITNQTMTMYNPVADLFYADYSDVSLRLEPETTYIDLYLYALNIAALDAPSENLIPIFNEGVKRLQVQAEYSHQISQLAVFTEVPFSINRRYHLLKNSENSTFVFEDLNKRDEDVVGMILYGGNSITPLTSKYPIDKYVADENIDVIVQLSGDREPEKVYPIITIATDEFYYEKTHLTETKIVCFTYRGNYFQDFKNYFDVYLKILDGSNNGFWYTIDMTNWRTAFVFISKSNRDACSAPIAWNILSTPMDSRSPLTNSFKTDLKPVDIFSHLSMLLNTKGSHCLPNQNAISTPLNANGMDANEPHIVSGMFLNQFTIPTTQNPKPNKGADHIHTYVKYD